jgi:hypothetical protein
LVWIPKIGKTAQNQHLIDYGLPKEKFQPMTLLTILYKTIIKITILSKTQRFMLLREPSPMAGDFLL